MEYYPIYLDLKNRPCLVVGGGTIALRKAEGLLVCGAKVHVISPWITPELREMENLNAVAAFRKKMEPGFNPETDPHHPVTFEERKYRPGDTQGYTLVIAATDDRPVNAQIYEEARELGIPVNVVDDPPLCGFILPSIIRRGPVTIAFSTSGRSPALARRLREYLERAIGPEYGELADLLGELRPLMKQHIPTEEARNDVMDEMLSRGVLKLLRQGKREEALEVAEACICSSSA
ncbi:MAG: bifunctional precorrin-2 dehydrogenase/sirohydrochlorin ferrochelatase [Armatimonadetes bacterium]|nr:bifunctional precorrin-2 dehydrogenase/sirohydrochlorin ferrochelatase [Armatimonadota bacterium]